MTRSVLCLVGTQRGLFLLNSDPARKNWSLRGPLADPGWAFTHLTWDPDAGTLYAAGHNAWYGPAVWRSPDLGQSWSLSSEGITYGDAGPTVRQIWHLRAAHGVLYAGVDPAGLFRSDDGGATWREAGTPLRVLPEFTSWRPGKGGLPVHTILPHPTDPDQLWLALAGGGVLHTDDGGLTWEPRNPVLSGGEPALRVQKLAMAAGRPNLLYQQNHRGVFRSRDGGRSWANITAGLPTEFGFVLAAHPHDPDTLYTIPHQNVAGNRHCPDGRWAVWRSRSGGDSWTRLTEGLPAEPAYASVLREGLTADTLDPAGIYFGTRSGHLFASFDEGDTWTTLAAHLPEIHSVSAVVL